MLCPSLMPTQRMPPDAKWSGEGSQISWVYSLKLVKTYEIVRSLIRSTSLTHYFKYLYFFELVFRKIFWTLLGYSVPKAPASQRNSTCFLHQTVSPCERVGSGDEASFVPHRLWSAHESDCRVQLRHVNRCMINHKHKLVMSCLTKLWCCWKK